MVRLKNILDLGISESLDMVESNKQRVFNLFIFLALPSIPLILILNVVRGNHEMAIMNSIQMLVIIFSFWISYNRRLLFLRTYLLFLLSTIIFISAALFRPGVEYRLLMVMVVGVILFDNNFRFLIFSLLIACEFTFCKYLEFKNLTNTNTVLLLRIAQIFIPFIITCISLYYLKHIYLKSQLKLQKTLMEVSLANEMHEKLMFSLAHDLRSPLSNLTSLVNHLKKHQGFSNEELKWLEMIELSSINSNVLVNDLLESTDLMKNKIDLQPNDLNVIIDNVIHTAQLKANSKDIRIDFKKWEPTCFLNVDAVKIDRLISNLLNNAIKFSYPSGNIQIILERNQDAITILIKDHGIGIPENMFDSIFDPFTKSKRKGTSNEPSFGLGLSICKQITELHGGTIKVSSLYEKGTDFIVNLPNTMSA